MQFYATKAYLLIKAGLMALRKKYALYFQSTQKRVTTIYYIQFEISAKRPKMGSNEFFTPFTNKCAKYLLLSKNKLRVCCGESLKFLEMEMTKNSRIFYAFFSYFLCTQFISTFNGFCSSLGKSFVQFSCFLNKNYRTFSTGVGSMFNILLFSAYYTLNPNFFSISHKIFQLYNLIAGVEFSLIASSFSNECASGCWFIISFMIFPTYTPS